MTSLTSFQYNSVACIPVLEDMKTLGDGLASQSDQYCRKSVTSDENEELYVYSLRGCPLQKWRA